MKSLQEYIIERGPAPKVELSKKSICLLDTNPTNYDDNSIDDVDAQIEADYNDFMEIIDKVNKEYQGFLVCGTLGLWHGKKDIYPEYFDDLTNAVKKCWDKMDYAGYGNKFTVKSSFIGVIIATPAPLKIAIFFSS